MTATNEQILTTIYHVNTALCITRNTLSDFSEATKANCLFYNQEAQNHVNSLQEEMRKPENRIEKVYSRLSNLVQWYGNLIECDDQEKANTYLPQCEKEIQEIMGNHLPHGSGFDSGCKLNLDESKPERLVIDTGFHHMDEMGGYDKWTEHQVIVTPSLWRGFNLRITGRNYRDIKEYMYEMFDYALHREIVGI